MVLDSSAVVAIAMQEPGYDLLIERVAGASAVLIGGPTALESAMVLTSRMGTDATAWLTGFLRSINAEIVSLSEKHYEVAAHIFVRYGKGRHPAALNFGDCMAYAVASVAKEPLLFTGSDFSKAGLRPA